MKEKIVNFIDDILGPLLIVPVIVIFTFGPIATAIYLDQEQMDQKEADYYASRDRKQKLSTFFYSEGINRIKDYAQDCPR